MNISVTSREATAIRNSLNGWTHSDQAAAETAKRKFEKLVQDDAARTVKRIIKKTK